MDIERQLHEAMEYMSANDRERVLVALERSKLWHEGQKRISGDPYVIHPITVALYLCKLRAGRETVIAALLHDAVEDEKATLQQVKSEFGDTVAKLVDGVTKLSKHHYESGRRAERQVASLRKLMLTANDDLRVIFIKLADRRHNVETLAALPPEKQQRIAHETLEIYVPFARIVGLWELKTLFEEACFPIAYPQESAEWHGTIARLRQSVQEERNAFIQRLNEETSDDVQAELRPMTDYEVYQKMQGIIDRLGSASTIDSVLIKVQSQSPVDCYHVMGEIHARYPVRSGTFHDYISAPQSNGYRALHTTIFLSQRHEVRLRIQTQEMYEFASTRMLSTWLGDQGNDIYQALSGLHAVQGNHDQYVNDLKRTVLEKRMSIFTTSGDIVSLPLGATGVDFAFAINPDHVSSLSGVRVDGELHEATYLLKQGDTVELVLLENGKSELRSMWVDKVTLVGARETLRKSLRYSPKNKRREEGRHLLEVACSKRRLPLWWLVHFPPMQGDLARAMQRKSFEALLEDVGSGLVPVGTVADAYRNLLIAPTSWKVILLKLFHLLPRMRVLNKDATVMDVEIYAQDRLGLIHDIAQCCVDRNINMSQFSVYATPHGGSFYKMRVEVKNFDQFSDLYDSLVQVPSIRSVLRKR